ncbi:MAG TPA: ThiF family adenylyltransferase, partial [Thermomicrobiales bacterium]|nr:ThiF family adenylyltransferase [Thermomicrobiales bacterium]
RQFFPTPPARPVASDPVYDRHARMFGDLGQQRLRNLKVGIIGAGGGGSLLSQLLAHLGVGHLVVIDHDRVDLTNLPRIVGATRWDARSILTARRFAPLRRLGKRLATHKVRVAERVARSAQPGIRFDAVVGDIVDSATVALIRDVDALFLATDTMQSRLAFNSVVHQYLIPGFQIGAKVQVDARTRQVESAFAVARPVLPYERGGCMLCNGLIPADRLQMEALTPAERAAQRYVDDEEVHEPSVITLNAMGAAQAANDLLMMVTELFEPEVELGGLMHQAREHTTLAIEPRTSPTCPDCGATSRSRLARGDRRDLPCRIATATPCSKRLFHNPLTRPAGRRGR